MNTCNKCGNILKYDEKICSSCGTPVNSGDGFSTGFGGGNQNNFGEIKTKSIKSLIEETGSFNDTSNNSQEPLPVSNDFLIDNGANTSNNIVQPVNNENGDNKKILIALGAFIVIIAGVLLIFGSKIFGGSEDKKVEKEIEFVLDEPTAENPLENPGGSSVEDPVEPSEVPTDPEPEEPDEPEEPSEPDKPSNTKEVSYGGYTFDIPNEYGSMITNNSGKDFLYITASSMVWGVAIGIDDGSYQRISSSTDELKKLYEDSGFVVNNMKQSTYSNLSFVLFESENTTNGDKGIVAFTSAGTNKVFCVTVYNASNTYSYDVLEMIAEIIYNAKVKTQGI